MILGQQIVHAVELHRATIRVEQDQQGEWNLSQLFERIHSSPQSGTPPPILVRDSNVEIIFPGKGTLRVEGINLDVEIAEQIADEVDSISTLILDIKGNLKSNFIERLEFASLIDLRSQLWTLAIDANDVILSERLLDFVTPKNYEQLISLFAISKDCPAPESFGDNSSRDFASTRTIRSLRGTLNLSGHATGNLKEKQLGRFNFVGKLVGAALDDISLPYAINDLSCHVEATNEFVHVKDLIGRVDSGRVQLEFLRYGWGPTSPWHLIADMADFRLDSKLFPWLPERLQKLWQDYSPEGVVSVNCEFRHNGVSTDSDVTAQVHRGSFSFVGAPFRFNDCQGQIYYTEKQLKLALRAEEHGTPISISADFRNPGPNCTGKLVVESQGFLPFNRKALATLVGYPKALDAVEAFNATGEFQVKAVLEKFDAAQRKPTPLIDVNLRNTVIRHRNFEYRLFDVSGHVRIHSGRCEFIQLQGARDYGYVVCNGEWSESDGLLLNFDCHSIALDDHLRNALRPAYQELWGRLQPVGTIDSMQVSLEHQRGWTEPKLQILGRIFDQVGEAYSDVSIEPTWFPYRVSQLTGEFQIGDGAITLHRFSGVHNDTWISFAGEGSYNDSYWKMALKDLLVGGLDMNEDLYRALPMSLEDALRKLDLKGQVEVEGQIVLQGNIRETRMKPSRTSTFGSDRLDATDGFRMSWDIRLTAVNVDMYVGVPIKNLTGQMRLIGRLVDEQPSSIGEIVVDSMMYQGMQVTNLRGPVSIEPSKIAIGSWASMPPEFGPAEPLQGDLVDGRLGLDAQINAGQNGEFYVRLTAQSFDLNALATELSTQSKSLSGKGYCGILLTGNVDGSSEVRGDGYVRLRDAKLYELPVILALLNVAKIAQADRSAFDESNIDFTVMGSNIELNRIELIGDMISLIGTGDMNLDQQINLDFYTVMGRNRLYIPLITQLYRAGSQQILWINVSGTLQEPKTTHELWPGLTDSIRQVLLDFENSRTGVIPSGVDRNITPLPNYR
ncbi:MAG TPA: hypothetical protein PKD64_04950 [Pirellulaceae bacterium]|nr:hypothetical protein [Pirellulaceae bacterium]